MLIPAYKDMNPYDLPEEFSHLQAQDMSKLGFMQDLIRGIKKITQTDEPKKTVIKETVISGGNASTAPLLKRAFMFLEDGDWASADEYCEKVLDIEPENAQAYLGKLMAELGVKKQDELKNLAEPFEEYGNYQKAMRFGDEEVRSFLSGCNAFIIDRNETARKEEIYQRAKELITAEDEEDVIGVDTYLTAGELFESIGEYKDASTLAYECYENARKIVYDNAQEIMESAEEEKAYLEAAELFESVGEYRDAHKLAEECREKAEAARKDWILWAATDIMKENSIKDFEYALEELMSISGWKDADEQIEICKIKIEELKAKAEKERKERERKIKKIAKIVIPTVCVLIAAVLILKMIIIPKMKYNDAMTAIDDKNYTRAYELLKEVDGYKDSSKVKDSIVKTYMAEKFGSAKVGDYITFGVYEQDNDEENGKEDVEWLVLATDGNRKLLISKYGLDCKPYNVGYERITWEKCTLRKWLNKEFINDAFTEIEQEMIPVVTVTADTNPEYDTNPGNITLNKIFLLSIVEANEYFGSDAERQCEATAYAEEQGVFAYYNNMNSPWWLRSPGSHQDDAARVDSGGNVYKYGKYVDFDGNAVRPALWVEFE